jgi:hypothetical protein
LNQGAPKGPGTSPGDNGTAPPKTSSEGVGDLGVTLGPDLGAPADLATPRPPLDLSSTDLAGLVNCFGVAICDPRGMFCIRYHSGSMANPGTVTFGPACYEPATACADNGQNMDCGCIQADDTLGGQCQGACVDNMNGTYECYAMM